MKKYKGAIFDLDGVIVDTAKYHYLAWKRLAAELGFHFTEKDNERLKGVSRMRSLEILLEVGGLTFPEDEMQKMAAKKNAWYVEYLEKMDESELLPGAKEFLLELRRRGVKTSLGSASKNSPMILEKLHITELFDAVVDGNSVSAAKPDPEVFIKGVQALELDAADCVVFEDSQSGIEAAHAAGCGVVAIGTEENLKGGDLYAANLGEVKADNLFI